MPKVSIVIPTYNVGPWIEETLKSVARQTFRNFECIVVDDGSIDDTQYIVSEFCKKDSRFQLKINRNNIGVSNVRNMGMNMASGEYISFLDGDDLWHSEFIESMLNIINKKQAWVAYSRFALFKDGTNIRKPLIWDNLLRTKNIWWDMLMITEFCTCSWLGRLDVVRSIGGFNPHLRVGEDRDFLLRLLESICFKHCEKVSGTDRELFFYRQREGSAVRNAREALDTEWEMMREHIEHIGVPLRIRRRAWSFLAFKMAVIAGFGVKDISTALRWYSKAIYYDIFNVNIYWLPLVKIYNEIFMKKGEIKFS